MAGRDLAGKDRAEAAWLIAQHATGEADFQRRALKPLQGCGGGEQDLPGMRSDSETESR